jgi:hypothetical protein
MPNVTQFFNAKQPGNFIIRDSVEVISDIKNGTYKDLIEKLNGYDYDSPEQVKFKSENLHAIAWNGIFSYRANKDLKAHSDVAIDFDHIPENLTDEHKKKLSDDPYTYALFRSPRRDCLKCIARVPASIKITEYMYRRSMPTIQFVQWKEGLDFKQALQSLPIQKPKQLKDGSN